MFKGLRGTAASLHLDLIRGIAAIVVLLTHVRYLFFLMYKDIAAPTLLDKVFYSITSCGHEAVIVFFVLSGFFVAGSVMQDCQKERWSWKRYLGNRLTRLYVVLIPALLLTVCWDRLGRHFYGSNVIYTGEPAPWSHTFYSVMARDNLTTWLGNAFYLQTILVSPFGSNEALWSLANEFWYYLLFPFLFVGLFASRSRQQTVLYLLCGLAIMLFVGRSITLYFSVWLMGAMLCRLPRLAFLSRRKTWWLALMLATALLLAVLAGSQSTAFKALLRNKIGAVDFLVGISFSMLVYVLLHCSAQAKAGFYARFATGFAGFSYSLYALHLPMLFFLRAWLNAGAPWRPSLKYVLVALLLAAAAMLYAWIISRVTEAKTDFFRRTKIVKYEVCPTP